MGGGCRFITPPHAKPRASRNSADLIDAESQQMGTVVIFHCEDDSFCRDKRQTHKITKITNYIELFIKLPSLQKSIINSDVLSAHYTSDLLF